MNPITPNDKNTKTINEPPKDKRQTLNHARHSFEDHLEKLLFASRWILAPMYLILILVLFLILIRFMGNVWHFINLMTHTSLNDNEWIMYVLELLDLTLVANLVLIVAFSGYENFVSKMDAADDDSRRLSWMGRLDFSGLKLKIIGSIVAISLIELLQDFLNISAYTSNTVQFWRIALHLVFLVSGFIFAKMEVLSEKRHEMKNKDEMFEMQNKF